MFETITSVQNNRVKHLVRLRDGSHRRRQGRFLIEGLREIQRALASGWPLESLFFCEEFFKDQEAYDLLDKADDAGLEILRLGRDPFLKAAYRQGPDGLIAVGHQRDWQLEELTLGQNPLLVILEGIEKPGNFGAILRAANAAGADAIILTGTKTDPFNPNAIRSSQGAFFATPVCQADAAAIQAWLGEKGIQVVATSPDASRLLWDADLTGPVALVLGAEDTGLTGEWLGKDTSWRIPMKGVTDSLNVAATAAVCLFEAVRQRQSVS